MSPKSRGRRRKPAVRPHHDDPFGDALLSKMLRVAGRDLDGIDDALRAEMWAGLPAQAQRGLEEVVEEVAAAVDDPGAADGLADAVLDGLLDGDTTPEQVQETVTRRVFATPNTTAVLDGEPMQLDPSDPDERGILIRAEHPEYADVLDDPVGELAADGVNPRLHVAMHAIVANQLWDGDPPGCGRPRSACWPPGWSGTTCCTRWPRSPRATCTPR